MRRLAALAALALALAAAGCGSDSGPGSEGPLDEALGYLPEDAPFAVAISTDTGGDQLESLDSIVDKFPFSGQLKEGLRKELTSQDVDFDKDVKPLLGNDFVVGTDDPKNLTADGDAFVGAIEVKDEDKLRELVKRDAKQIGEKNGAKLYQSNDDRSVSAVKGDVLVVADSRRTLERALAQRDEDDRLREEQFNEALDGLPDDALVRVYADLQSLLKSDPDAAQALKIKWVGALRQLGLTASAEKDAIVSDFRIKTEGDLSDADLPIASGDDAPKVVSRPGEIAFGLRDLAQTFRFGEQAAQATNRGQFGDYLRSKQQISKRLGIDLDRDLVGQFAGDASVSVDVRGRFGLRSELEDARRFESTLAKLADRLPAVARRFGGETVGIAKPSRGQDFYALATPDGDHLVFGVVDGEFVLANDARKASVLAAATPKAVEGAKGALVMRANAEQLAEAAIERMGGVSGLQGIGARLFIAPLGELTGSMSASTEELRGTIRLGID
jgi:hypothetical protein